MELFVVIVVLTIAIVSIGYVAFTVRRSVKHKSSLVTNQPPEEVEETIDPMAIMTDDFNGVLKRVLGQVKEVVANMPPDWKYQYIELMGRSGYFILQKFDNGVVLCRVIFEYNHQFFNEPHRHFVFSGMSTEAPYIAPKDFLDYMHPTVVENIKMAIAGVIATEYDEITPPRSLTVRSHTFPELAECVFGINLAYSMYSDNVTLSDRETYYDDQATIRNQYKDVTSLMVKDHVFSYLDEIVLDIKTKEAISQVMTTNKWQQITLIRGGASG